MPLRKNVFWSLLALLGLACSALPPAPSGSALISRQEFMAASWGPLGSLASWKPTPRGAQLTLADGRPCSVTFFSPDAVEFWVPSRPGQQELPLVNLSPEAKPFAVTTVEQGQELWISSDTVSLHLKKANLAWQFFRNSVLVASGEAPQQAGAWVRDQVKWGKSSLSGLGPTGDGWIKNGQSVKFWNDLPGNKEQTSLMDVPFVYAWDTPSPYAVLWNDPGQVFINLKPKGYLGGVSGGMPLLLVASDTSRGVLQTWAQLNGRPFWGPYWAVGTRLVAHSATLPLLWRAKKIPVDTVVGVPQAQMNQDYFYQVGEGPGLTGDGANLGVVFPPATEKDDQLHNLWTGKTLSALWGRWKTAHPQLRPWFTAETGSAGTTSQAVWLVKADVSQDPSRLLNKILSAQMSGLGAAEIRLSVESLVSVKTSSAAWQNLAVWAWSPYLTLDAGRHEDLWWQNLGPDGQARLKAILDQRSRFVPYFYQLTLQAHRTGVPVWRPLGWSYPNDPQARAETKAFLVGPDLLVTVPEGEGSVYLPGRGSWFALASGQEYAGGTSYSLPPGTVLARSGALVPTQQPYDEAGKDVDWRRTVQVWPGSSGKVELWWDDGSSWNYQQGSYLACEAVYTSEHRTMSLKLNPLHAGGTVSFVLFRIHNVYRPRQVLINGSPIPLFGDSFGLTDTDRSAAWYEDDHTLLMKIFSPDQPQDVEVQF